MNENKENRKEQKSGYLLEMLAISKSFPGVKALDNVDLRIKPGTVHALMGENGAGKSTLMKCLFGIYHKDQGDVIFDGEKREIREAKHALDLGISMIHQELHPIYYRSIMENIWLGRYPMKGVGAFKPFVDHQKMYDDTEALFKDLGIQLDPKSLMRELSVSQIQLIEIAKAVSYNSKIIVMDEPTSSLTSGEVEHLFRIINDLRKRGVAIIYISHKMEEILRISDEVTILRDGTYIGTWPSKELTMDLIISRMVGRDLTQRFPHRESEPHEESIMEVRNLTSPIARCFKDVSFDLKKGEILGVSGLVGAQRTELMEAIFGLRSVAEGTVKIHGELVDIKSPRDSIEKKMALLTEERRATGIFPILNVLDNTVIASQDKYMKYGIFTDAAKRKEVTKEGIEKLRVKTPSEKTHIKNLSGGNQQKVLIARWLLTQPDILLLDEPTRGIDVGAKFEIYTIMADLAKEGKSIVFISSELPELLGMADRILVMCEGRVSGIVDGKEATEEKVMALATQFMNSEEEGDPLND